MKTRTGLTATAPVHIVAEGVPAQNAYEKLDSLSALTNCTSLSTCEEGVSSFEAPLLSFGPACTTGEKSGRRCVYVCPRIGLIKEDYRGRIGLPVGEHAPDHTKVLLRLGVRTRSRAQNMWKLKSGTNHVLPPSFHGREPQRDVELTSLATKAI